MLILRDASSVPAAAKGSVLALGNFDGLHTGHQAVIGKAIALARAQGSQAGVMTFEPHPRRVFKPELPSLRLLSFAEKARNLRDMGVDFMRVVHFTRAFSRTSAETFVTGILVKELNVAHVVTGEDFVFGHNREGDAGYLQRMAVKLGFDVTACAPVLVAGERCSSTRIRAALEKGDVQAAAKLLGRPYAIRGCVREGDKRGRQLGFPTANIIPGQIFTPAAGVYAVRAKADGKWLDGVANLGVRPTFGGARLQLETHLFDWQGNLYGKHMEVAFAGYIRPEQKFSGVDALKAQIEQDSKKAHAILADW